MIRRQSLGLPLWNKLGEQMHHSQRVFFLGTSEPLEYHGEVSGWTWNPLRHSREFQVSVEAFFGQGFLPDKSNWSVDETAAALWKSSRLCSTLRSPEFLVETRDLLTIYPALGNYVRNNFPLVASADGYAVYDLAGAGTEGGVQ